MLAENYKGYGGSTTIVKLDTKGNQLGTYSIQKICPNGALGITAADGTNEKFIIMHYTDSNNAGTLTFSVVNWKESDAECTCRPLSKTDIVPFAAVVFPNLKKMILILVLFHYRLPTVLMTPIMM